jgi:hypothetical protein
VKRDSEVTEQDVASSNLVVWGDPAGNSYLRTVVDRLPIAWGPEAIKVGDRSFPAADHVLLMICPNPLDPSRYLVLNSGPTQREADYLNNARQTPKLPDWALIDATSTPDPTGPGRVVDADFFGEDWRPRPPRPAEQP